jgi:hypothetical protein
MPRPCGWCVSPLRAAWEVRVRDGEPISRITLDTPYSETAARRHIRFHLDRLGLSIQQTDSVQETDFSTRLLELANRARSVGDFGLATGDGRLALMAGKQEAAHLVTLVGRLGIESTDAANEYGEAEQIVKAVGRVLRSGQHPELVAELTSELAAAGYTDLVRDLRAITSNQDQVKV